MNIMTVTHYSLLKLFKKIKQIIEKNNLKLKKNIRNKM